MHDKKPRHKARNQVILNTPADIRPVILPNGSGVTPLVLGDVIFEEPEERWKPLPPDPDPAIWWPTAPSSQIREHFLRRMRREGYALQLATSICIGLLRGVYTTSFIRASDHPYKKTQRRVRLQYRKSPVSDFGIVKGVAHVESRNRLAYVNAADGLIQEGQDPEEHYWIYFTTLSGEEVTLDCSLYSFNFISRVRANPYNLAVHNGLQSVPACFLDLKNTPNAAHITTPFSKFSVLRNKNLQKAIEDEAPAVQWGNVFDFLKLAAGTQSTAEENLIRFWTLDSCGAIEELIRKRSWERWPTEPVVETEDPETECDINPAQDWLKYVDEWNRSHDHQLHRVEHAGW